MTRAPKLVSTISIELADPVMADPVMAEDELDRSGPVSLSMILDQPDPEFMDTLPADLPISPSDDFPFDDDVIFVKSPERHVQLCNILEEEEVDGASRAQESRTEAGNQSQPEIPQPTTASSPEQKEADTPVIAESISESGLEVTPTPVATPKPPVEVSVAPTPDVFLEHTQKSPDTLGPTLETITDNSKCTGVVSEAKTEDTILAEITEREINIDVVPVKSETNLEDSFVSSRTDSSYSKTVDVAAQQQTQSTEIVSDTELKLTPVLIEPTQVVSQTKLTLDPLVTNPTEIVAEPDKGLNLTPVSAEPTEIVTEPTLNPVVPTKIVSETEEKLTQKSVESPIASESLIEAVETIPGVSETKVPEANIETTGAVPVVSETTIEAVETVPVVSETKIPEEASRGVPVVSETKIKANEAVSVVSETILEAVETFPVVSETKAPIVSETNIEANEAVPVLSETNIEETKPITTMLPTTKGEGNAAIEDQTTALPEVTKSTITSSTDNSPGAVDGENVVADKQGTLAKPTSASKPIVTEKIVQPITETIEPQKLSELSSKQLVTQKVDKAEKTAKEDGKQKRGVISKILEFVGVSPKSKKDKDDGSKSVFYDSEIDIENTPEELPAPTTREELPQEELPAPTSSSEDTLPASAPRASPLMFETSFVSTAEKPQERLPCGETIEEILRATDLRSLDDTLNNQASEVVAEMEALAESLAAEKAVIEGDTIESLTGKLNQLTDGLVSETFEATADNRSSPAVDVVKEADPSSELTEEQALALSKVVAETFEKIISVLEASTDVEESPVVGTSTPPPPREKKRSPSPRVLIGPPVPQTNIISPTPPTSPGAPPVFPTKGEQSLVVEDTILETPPLSSEDSVDGEKKTPIFLENYLIDNNEELLMETESLSSDIENIIKEAKSYVETKLAMECSDDQILRNIGFLPPLTSDDLGLLGDVVESEIRVNPVREEETLLPKKDEQEIFTDVAVEGGDALGSSLPNETTEARGTPEGSGLPEVTELVARDNIGVLEPSKLDSVVSAQEAAEIPTKGLDKKSVESAQSKSPEDTSRRSKLVAPKKAVRKSPSPVKEKREGSCQTETKIVVCFKADVVDFAPEGNEGDNGSGNDKKEATKNSENVEKDENSQSVLEETINSKDTEKDWNNQTTMEEPIYSNIEIVESKPAPVDPKKCEVEEIKVTSLEDRQKHKRQATTSKLSGQILKAIPPPRRKAISDAKAQEPQQEAEPVVNVTLDRPLRVESVPGPPVAPPPVPPRRNRSRQRQPPLPPPKRKTKK